MARIPRYVRDSLASQAVGTPGLDQSANILSNSVQDATGQLAYADTQNRISTIQGLGGIAYDAVRAIGAGITLQRAQQKLIDNDQLNRAMYDYDQQLLKNEEMAKTANTNNPTVVHESFRRQAEQVQKSFLYQMEKDKLSKNVRMRFAMASNNVIKQRTHGLSSWGLQEAKNRVAENMKVMGEQLPLNIGASNTVEELLDGQVKIAEHGLMFEQSGMGKNVDPWINKTSKESARQFLIRQAEIDPDKTLKEHLNDPRIERFGLQQSDLIAIKNRAEGRKDELRAKANRELRDAKTDYQSDLTTRLMPLIEDKYSIEAAETGFNMTRNELHELARTPVEKRSDLDKYKIQQLASKVAYFDSRRKAAIEHKRVEDNRAKALQNAIVAGNAKLARELKKAEAEEKQKRYDDWVSTVSQGKGLEVAMAAKEAYKFATVSDSKMPPEERMKRINEARELIEKNHEYLDPPDKLPKNYSQMMTSLNALARTTTAKTPDQANAAWQAFTNAVSGFFNVDEGTKTRLNPSNEPKRSVAVEQAGSDAFSKTVEKARIRYERKPTRKELEDIAKTLKHTLTEADIKKYL